VIGANDQIKSAAVLMFAGESADTQVLLLADKKSSLKLSSAASNQQTVLGSGADGGYGLFLSRGNVGSASLTSAGSGAGYLSIANSKGAIVAEGGSKPSGIGIFRTGPSCCTPPGAVGPHQYIVGRQE
jgi:hypothetical protein